MQKIYKTIKEAKLYVTSWMEYKEEDYSWEEARSRMILLVFSLIRENLKSYKTLFWVDTKFVIMLIFSCLSVLVCLTSSYCFIINPICVCPFCSFCYFSKMAVRIFMKLAMIVKTIMHINRQFWMFEKMQDFNLDFVLIFSTNF